MASPVSALCADRGVKLRAPNARSPSARRRAQRTRPKDRLAPNLPVTRAPGSLFFMGRGPTSTHLWRDADPRDTRWCRSAPRAVRRYAPIAE